IKYTDQSGVEYTLDADLYEVDTLSLVGRVVLAPDQSWPSVDLRSVNGICIRFVCGYGDDAAAVPEGPKLAMKMVIGHWRRNPEAVLVGSISKEVEFAVRALLSPDEVMRV
ncbi:MAG: head-tail connector protein, partial [Clostridia bacterium]|nr:head-tail connector protein [Clostridia bacterium]